jgi:hypothetical protein
VIWGRRWSRCLTPITVGLVLTAIVLILSGIMAVQRRCSLNASSVLECRSNLAWFLDSPPNEIGDTLAGFAGALAFICIVVTVWLQSHELSEQREELKLTRDELKGQRRAAEEMAEAAKAHAELIKLELEYRHQDDVVRSIEKLLLRADDLGTVFQQTRHWWEKRAYTKLVNGVEEEGMVDDPVGLPIGNLSSLVGHRNMKRGVKQFLEHLKSGEIFPRDGRKSGLRSNLQNLIEKIEEAATLSEKLSGSRLEWYKEFEFDRTITVLRHLYDADLWDPKGWGEYDHWA